MFFIFFYFNAYETSIKYCQSCFVKTVNSQAAATERLNCLMTGISMYLNLFHLRWKVDRIDVHSIYLNMFILVRSGVCKCIMPFLYKYNCEADNDFKHTSHLLCVCVCELVSAGMCEMYECKCVCSYACVSCQQCTFIGTINLN